MLDKRFIQSNDEVGSSNMRVLIVDDFATMRRVISGLLHDLKITETDEASCYDGALSKMREQAYDLLIVDWNMPKAQGVSLLKAVRSDAQLRTTPVLMIMGSAKREQIMEAAQAGVSGFIVKPFTADMLQEKITRIFGRKNGLLASAQGTGESAQV